ncbi:peroxiredoxin family protein [Dethiothermospora halolimnae]|uniref:peroxiredoxin family protein n=1 Tax=Dethiothermospora halolimnae TaxID=3114390 RepID=UPI003CCB7B5C
MIIIWAIALTGYAGYSFYNNMKISRAMKVMNSPELDIEKIGMGLQLKKDKDMKLKEVVKEENTFLIFFSPSCEACVKELEFINKSYKGNQLKKKPILITASKKHIVDKFIEDKDIPFEYYFITEEELDKKIGAGSIPLSFVIDKEGNVKMGKNGWSSDKSFQEELIEKVNSFN